MGRFLLFLALVAGATALLAYWLAVGVPRAVDRALEAFAEEVTSGIGPQGYVDCGRIGDSAPAFSPDGRELAYAHCDASGHLTVRAVPVTGGRPRTLFEWDGVGDDERQIEELAWASDGRIAFVTGFGQPSSLRVWNPERGEIGPLVDTESVLKSGTAWSPDTRSIAYVRDSWLVVVDARKGGALRTIRRVDGEAAPAWSPDGSKLVFASSSDLWLADAAARLPPRRVKRYAWCSGTWLSGERFAHVDPTDPHHLVVLTTSGTRVRRTPLGPAPILVACPDATAPHARRFAFVDDPLGDGTVSTIWVLDAQEARMRRLTDGR